jgi:trehalose/maltose hydrolase-like predicted phosphorylase
VPFHQGVLSQFDGYGDLTERDWHGYRTRYAGIRRLGRILEAEGDSVNRYQASKQADVLMFGYLFSPAELRDLRRLGHDVDDEVWRRTVDYYLRRTSNGSTLSGLVHGLVLARARRAEAWSHVHEALQADIADTQGGTTGEGMHLGAMAGTLDLVQRGLTGLETREDALWLDPVPLPALSEYGFSLRYRGHWGSRHTAPERTAGDPGARLGGVTDPRGAGRPGRDRRARRDLHVGAAGELIHADGCAHPGVCGRISGAGTPVRAADPPHQGTPRCATLSR